MNWLKYAIKNQELQRELLQLERLYSEQQDVILALNKLLNIERSRKYCTPSEDVVQVLKRYIHIDGDNLDLSK